MVKKGRLILTTFFVIVFSGINLLFYFNKGTLSYSGVSGMFIKEIPDLPLNLNISIISFVGLWVLILIIVFIAFINSMKSKREENIKINLNKWVKKSKSDTDIDGLYNILKEKKKLNLGTIARTFKITKENALDWSKILENHELVIIDYPTFGEPTIRIYEKEKEAEQEGKDTDRKQKKIEKETPKEKPKRKHKKRR